MFDEKINVKTDKFDFLIGFLVQELKKYSGEEIEIESRLGKLTDVFTGEKINISAIHPVIFKQEKNMRFETGVHTNDYDKIKEIFKERDSVKTQDRTSSYKGMRTTVSGDQTLTIKKTRLLVFDIYLPDCPYDLRIAVSKEQKMPNVNTKEGKFERERERESFKIDNLQYDFTIVKSLAQNETQYEVETEMIESSGDVEQFLRCSLNLADSFTTTQ